MSFPRGTTARLYQVFTNANDAFINPPDPRVDILDPAAVAVVTDAIPVNDSVVGHYHYDYAIAGDADPGTYTQHVTATIDGQVVSADEDFEVRSGAAVTTGHTLTEWQTKVGKLIRETGADLSASLVETVGIHPAIAKFSTDRPRDVITEVAGDDAAYFDLPEGWVPGFSSLTSIEHPARQDPPERLESTSWRIVRSHVDVDVHQILLDRSPESSEFVRFGFTAPWPVPSEIAGDDPIDDVAFEAVSALAASFCLTALAAEASRSRSMAMATDWTDSRERARTLMEAAKMYRDVYNGFLGLGVDGGPAGNRQSDAAPASGYFDFDPSHQSIFHGGRR